jgi:hypothetical protein
MSQSKQKVTQTAKQPKPQKHILVSLAADFQQKQENTIKLFK